ncbi:hypothetical protein TNCV_4626761 [Trichonephila clavipes]|nr:hypothetical protein TNCV_4626761 [Trichonephila clavipes]
MRARNYYAHPNIRDHWALKCMNRCPDLEVCLKRDLQCFRPQASLLLVYRPNVAGRKGRVDIAQPVNRTQDLWSGSTIHYHSTLFGGGCKFRILRARLVGGRRETLHCRGHRDALERGHRTASEGFTGSRKPGADGAGGNAARIPSGESFLEIEKLPCSVMFQYFDILCM